MKTILLSLFFSTSSLAAEYVAIIDPNAAKLIDQKTKEKNVFSIKEKFRAFNQEMAILEIADEKEFKKNYVPNLFSYIEKNKSYKLLADSVAPPKIDVTDWDPKPVITDDYSYTKLWGVLNFGQKLEQTGTKKMDASIAQAWGYTQGARKVLVGVMDTGINYKHQDIAAKVWVGSNKKHGFNAVIPEFDTYDDNKLNHGTHVSGTIAAIPNNKIGIAGVAWNATIVPVKIFYKEGTTTTAIILKGLNWFYKNPNIKVINHSWGGGEYSKLMHDAFKILDSAGVINVFAAGNSNLNIDVSPSYPGSFNLANSIIVAAHDSKGKKPTFSNFGKRRVDIAAPGVNIYSLYLGKNSYQSLYGTSMATPHVTGAVAVLLGMFPDATPADIKRKIIDGGTVTQGLMETSRDGKRLNLLNAVTKNL